MRLRSKPEEDIAATMRMLDELDPVETANRLIDKKNSEGLRELQTNGLLEISVEALVLEPGYKHLFAENVFGAHRRSLMR